MKGLLLISAGIDSPVAGYLMKKQGVDVIAIHFDNRPFTDYKQLEKTKRLLRKLKIKKLYVIQHGKIQTEIIKDCFRRFQCVICRRLMFRIAEKIAKKEKCNFLITGENLGQVASQTLENLTVAANSIKMPILRPLLCYDKNETINLARKIETYAMSIEPSVCCKAVPKKPITKARLEKIESEENKLEPNKLINNAVKNAEIILL